MTPATLPIHDDPGTVIEIYHQGYDNEIALVYRNEGWRPATPSDFLDAEVIVVPEPKSP